MKYSEVIYNSGLSEEINRLCGLTEGAVGNAFYSNKAKITRVNEALDRYWFLASESTRKGTFDDTNQTSLPVETQNLVAGTNYYKISSFTSKVLQILKLAILDDDAKEMDLVREDFDDLIDFNELYTTDTAERGIPQYWAKMGDYIYLRPCPDYSETSGLRAYINRELSKFLFTTFTVTIASPGVFSATAHGLAANDALIFETDGALPTGLTTDTTVYYVISAGLTADAFEVSTTIGGSAVNTSGSQSGNHKFLKVSKEPGIPVIHHNYLARYAALPFLITNEMSRKNDIAKLMQVDEDAIVKYWAHRDKDTRSQITFKKRVYK